MVRAYEYLLKADSKKINGEIFNVGFKNQTVEELAMDVRQILGDEVEILKVKTDDNRSYHVSSKKIEDLLGFKTMNTVKDAVADLKVAFEKKLLLIFLIYKFPF